MSLLVSSYFAINGSVIAINGDSSAGTSNRQSDCFKNPTRRLARNVCEASRSSVDSNAHSSISTSRLCSTFAVNRQNSARTILEAWLLSVERHVVVWTFGEMNLRCIAPHPHLTYANLGLI